MCVRYTRRKETEEIPLLYNKASSQIASIPPSYNVAPGSSIVSMTRQDGENRIIAFEWGLIPSWVKDPASFNKMYNARGETIHEKKSFKNAFAQQRCLIFADGFYEWKKEDPDSNTIGTSKGFTKKTPYFIHLKDDSLFAFAGIYDIWEPKRTGYENMIRHTCAIITTEANELMSPIHDRMPVIIPPEHYDAWLDPENDDQKFLLSLLSPYPSDLMEAYEVTKFVNSTRNDSPECINPAGK